ncbi:hypothetical protein JKP88DRAFT_176882 [Tribonema minus]|uniref:Uncharacterized protein n=1 Tax=Tribonema minus TaxID=303371 RepID=A0A835ZDL7_9STRA|nr:hypothetical protein JKP88DRAFT_176882 [Tribonema minus]
MQLVLFGATFATGTYDNGNFVSLLHFPAENTDQTVFYFRLTEDLGGVNVYRKQLALRSTDSSMQASYAGGRSACSIMVSPKSEIANVDIVVLAQELLTSGFFITGLNEGVVQDLKIQLSTITAFPNNTDITVDYMLVSSCIHANH